MPKLLMADPHSPSKYSPSLQYFWESPEGFSHVSKGGLQTTLQSCFFVVPSMYKGHQALCWCFTFCLCRDRCSIYDSHSRWSQLCKVHETPKHALCCLPSSLRGIHMFYAETGSCACLHSTNWDIKQSLVYSNFSSLIRVQSLPMNDLLWVMIMTLGALGFSSDHPSFSIKSDLCL